MITSRVYWESLFSLKDVAKQTFHSIGVSLFEVYVGCILLTVIGGRIVHLTTLYQYTLASGPFYLGLRINVHEILKYRIKLIE